MDQVLAFSSELRAEAFKALTNISIGKENPVRAGKWEVWGKAGISQFTSHPVVRIGRAAKRVERNH